MSFAIVVHSPQHEVDFCIWPKILNWVYVRRIPGPIKYGYILCHKIFHHFRCVTEEKILLKDPGTIAVPFPALEQLFGKLQHIVASASFLRLAESFRYRSN